MQSLHVLSMPVCVVGVCEWVVCQLVNCPVCIPASRVLAALTKTPVTLNRNKRCFNDILILNKFQKHQMELKCICICVSLMFFTGKKEVISLHKSVFRESEATQVLTFWLSALWHKRHHLPNILENVILTQHSHHCIHKCQLKFGGSRH